MDKEGRALRKQLAQEHKETVRQAKKKYSPLQKKARSEQRLNTLCDILEGGKPKQPIYFDAMDRKIARNIFRAKYGNRKMRKPWANARVRDIGIVAYRDTLRATDPKKRHSSPKFPDVPQGSYAHDRRIRQRRAVGR